MRFILGRDEDDRTALDEQIDDAHDQLRKIDPSDDKFKTILGVLERLYAIKDNQKPDRISADTKAVIAGNLAGILLILNFERMHVATSKALGFVLRSRL